MDGNTSVKGEGKKLPKPNNMIVIPTNIMDFFKVWCIFNRPIINLTNKEIDILACFLYQRHELSKVVDNPTLLDTLVMSNEIKERVMKETNIKKSHLYVVINKFRKRKVLLGNVINPRLVPNIRKDDDGVFQYLLMFKYAGNA